tara:strand:+ start:841 stop:981 length:141 start_codon:yes stop_codon:yes gene_type:complete
MIYTLINFILLLIFIKANKYLNKKASIEALGVYEFFCVDKRILKAK